MARKRLSEQERSVFVDWVRDEMRSNEDFERQVAECFVDSIDMETFDSGYRNFVYGGPAYTSS
ncbi:MAG: hypothetical protein NTX53_19270 [candidate division WOR-3 bacterium]|nr:hypothetical protein [candidate division WOR-3 bacterium]